MMGTKWATNLYFPVKLSQADMQQIPLPRLEMNIHITYKTVEAGTILGLGVIGPLSAAFRKQSLLQGALRGGRYGAVIGLVVGPCLNYLKFRGGSTDESIWDRCYRLRYNRNQVRVDRMVTWAAIGGSAAAAYMGSAVLNGTVVGIFVGTISMALYNMIIMKGDKTK